MTVLYTYIYFLYYILAYIQHNGGVSFESIYTGLGKSQSYCVWTTDENSFHMKTLSKAPIAY